MMRERREEAILEEIKLRGSVVLTALAPRLGASVITLRRDLASLEERNLLKRVYGGAVAPDRLVKRRADRTDATIGLIVPTSMKYYSSIIDAVRDAAWRVGARVVLGITNYYEHTEVEQIAAMQRIPVDALIMTPAKGSFTGSLTWDALTAFPAPVVLVERAVDTVTDRGFDSVRSDHELGIGMALEHLSRFGHRRIALLTPPEANPTSDRLVTGYHQAIGELGLDALEVNLGVESDLWRRTQVIAEVPALEAIRAHEVTAIVVHPDDQAITLMQFLLSSSVRIPEDLSVVAYDDNFSELSPVPLTAIAPPAADLGRIALELCLRRLRQPNRMSEPSVQHTRILPRLRPRQSTGIPEQRLSAASAATPKRRRSGGRVPAGSSDEPASRVRTTGERS